MKHLVRAILEELGEDPQREDLKDTPERVTSSLQFLTSGYRYTLADVVAEGIFAAPSQGLVLQKDLEFYSLCEHHLLPFYGKVHVAYLPNQKIIGLSKIGQVVDMYARRLQVQEKLTEQIADALEKVLEPKSIWVMMRAEHLCVMMREGGKQHSTTVTRVARGELSSDIFLNTL